MRQLDACPACGSHGIRAYSLVPVAERSGNVHYAQSFCRECDLVFSNPVAEPSDLERYYRDEYYQNVETVYCAASPDLKDRVLARVVEAEQGLREMVLPYRSGGVFFEIGSGWGPILVAARRLGFEVAGVEPSEPAVEFARRELGLEGVKCALFDPKDWPAEWADVVYSHHTIEHVLDIDGFVAGIFRILKPGGIAVIGTENHRCFFWDSRRLMWRLKGSLMREFVTSHDHTYVFSRKSLCRLMQPAGLEVFKTWIYTKSLAEKHGNSRFRSIFTKGWAYGLHYLDVFFRRGGRIYIWCRKV